MEIFGCIFFLGFLPAVVSKSDDDDIKNSTYQTTNRTLDDWCALTCGPEQFKNIACEMGGKCMAQTPCIFDSLDKRKILYAHNTLRNRFAAGDEPQTETVQVANLAALSWDEDLAFTAGCNLARCGTVDQDHCHTTPSFKESAGQNLWSYTLTASTVTECDCHIESIKAVRQWYEELNLVTEDVIRAVGRSYVFESKISHFTQLVWAKTTHVGCSLLRNEAGGKTTCVMACNYGPAGNVEGARMFKEGKPCSQCSDKLKCGEIFDALCGDGRLTSSHTDLRSTSDVVLLLLLVNVSFRK